MNSEIKHFYSANGSFGYQRGLNNGLLILNIFETKINYYSDSIKLWLKLSCSVIQPTKCYAQNTYKELQDMIHGLSDYIIDNGIENLFYTAHQIIWMLNTEYEMFLSTKGNSLYDKGCSAVALTVGNKSYVAQTNDESPELWGDNGILMIYDSHLLIYTHPGYCSYFGMNQYGISVMWQYIDNGKRGESHMSVPTNIVLRELLFLQTTKQQCDYLKTISMIVPNNIIISDTSETINIEKDINTYTIISQPHSNESFGLAHTNHFIHGYVYQSDNPKLQNSIIRYKALQSYLSENSKTLTSLQTLLTEHPILRENNSTLFGCIFQHNNLSCYFFFKNKEPVQWLFVNLTCG